MQQTFDLTRKDLMPFGVVKDLRFDIDEIFAYCENEGLLDPEIYNDIKVSSSSGHEKFVRLNALAKMSFFVEPGADYLEGDMYRQLYLTEIKSEFKDHPLPELEDSSARDRLKRLDPKSPNYNPLVDELNYTRRNHLVKGVFAKILDSFSDQVTRVRLSYIAPHFKIKPHVDHDPSYIVRYHVPIRTNPGATFNVIYKGEAQSVHLPADGRVYFINAGLKHWAENNSDEWRLHLIVDVHGQNHLQGLIPL